MHGFSSCKMISSFLHDGEAVAQVGDSRLSKEELLAFIPSGITPEDSLRLAEQYINSWATDQVYLQIAEQQLSKEELDVTKELEEYRRSLIKYRYEQRYINERLDTSVSESQIEDYYSKNSQNFKLKIPIVKARFIKISADSPNLEMLKKKMSSTKMEEQVDLDSLANVMADRYMNYSEKWVDLIALSREFGQDYGTLLSKMKKSFIETEDAYGKVYVAYISDIKGVGAVPPVEYCYDSIKDIIISARRQQLLITLERDLLKVARDNETFVTF